MGASAPTHARPRDVPPSEPTCRTAPTCRACARSRCCSSSPTTCSACRAAATSASTSSSSSAASSSPGCCCASTPRTGRVDLREFFARRVRRLLPAALLVLAATNLAAWLVFPGERAGQVLRDSRVGPRAWRTCASPRSAPTTPTARDRPRPCSTCGRWRSRSSSTSSGRSSCWPCSPRSAAERPLGVAAPGRRVVRLVGAVDRAGADRGVLLHPGPGVGARRRSAAGPRRAPAGRPAVAEPRPGSRSSALAALAFDERTAFPGSAAALPVVGTVLVLLGGAPLRAARPPGERLRRPAVVLALPVALAGARPGHGPAARPGRCARRSVLGAVGGPVGAQPAPGRGPGAPVGAGCAAGAPRAGRGPPSP